MQASDRAVSWFGDVASGYRAATERWPWSWLRAAEIRAVMALVGDVRGRSAVDVGCGVGTYALRLRDAGASPIRAVDASPAMVAQAQASGLDARCGDVATVDLGRRWEVLVAAGVLEFVPDPAAVLAHLRHYADDGARLVVLLPADNAAGRVYRRMHARRGVEVRLYAPGAIAALAGGWQVEEVMSAGLFSQVARLRAV